MINAPDYGLVDMTAVEGDLVKAIKDIMPQFPNLTIKHVKGHQDCRTAYRNLPLEAQLNIDFD